jgi:prepilin-type N-terminal cleavage/methylation domain-containing protein/prepilin-type processing-associated H-X9-DG protein
MKRAFTLIELLVVIAIIAILAAILFPVFTQAKKSAKQIVCVVHIRQIGMAMMMYRSDYDDVWPAAVYVDNAPGWSPQTFWIGYDNNNGPNVGGFVGAVNEPAVNPPKLGMIDPYVKSEPIKVCPEQPQHWQMAMAYNMFYKQYPSPYYTTNPAAQGQEYGPGVAELWTDTNGLINTRGEGDSSIEEPSGTIVLWEHSARVPMCNFLQGVDWFDSPPIHLPFLTEHFNFLHRNGSTTLWADGHTKRTLFAQLRRPMFSVNKSIYQ